MPADKNDRNVNALFHSDGIFLEVAFIGMRTRRTRGVITADLNRVDAVLGHDFASRDAIVNSHAAVCEIIAVDLDDDRKLFAELCADRIENIAEYFRARFRIAAVFVRTLIECRADKFAQEEEMRGVKLNAVIICRLRANGSFGEQQYDLFDVIGIQLVNRYPGESPVDCKNRIDDRRLKKDFAVVLMNNRCELAMLIDESIGMKLNDAVKQSIVRRNGCNAGDDRGNSAFGELAIRVEERLGQIAVVVRECFPRCRPPQSIFQLQSVQRHFVEDIFHQHHALQKCLAI